MDKRDVFKYLFSEGIVPELRHIVTAASLILYDCDVKKWNEIASIDMKEKFKIVNKFKKERKRLSKKEHDMLWGTGWRHLKTGSWSSEAIKID